MREFDEIHAAQPGYVGTLVIEERAGRRLAVNLWDSEHHAAAARSVLGPDVQRLLGPLMVSPSELIGVGTVVATDLVP